MKKTLFLLIATVCANVLMSQELQDYYCKETVSGNKYTYTVKKDRSGKEYTLKNVNNIEYVTINGEERYITTEFGSFNTSVKIYRTKKLNNGSRVTGSAI